MQTFAISLIGRSQKPQRKFPPPEFQFLFNFISWETEWDVRGEEKASSSADSVELPVISLISESHAPRMAFVEMSWEGGLYNTYIYEEIWWKQVLGSFRGDLLRSIPWLVFREISEFFSPDVYFNVSYLVLYCIWWKKEKKKIHPRAQKLFSNFSARGLISNICVMIGGRVLLARSLWLLVVVRMCRINHGARKWKWKVFLGIRRNCLNV